MAHRHKNRCSTHFHYSDFILCGDAYNKSNIDNSPRENGSYEAISLLSAKLMDPIVGKFGSIILTSGFRSSLLLRHIKKRFAPRIDQHCALEKNSKGKLICQRAGAAADFYHQTVNSLDISKYIVSSLPFDRLYYYGDDKPLHVSYGPDHAHKISNMVFRAHKDRYYPRNISREDFLKL